MTELANKAMLVSLTICRWTARKKDKEVTAEIATQKGNDPAYGSFSKSLVGKEALAGVAAVVSEAREFHYANTLPWSDKGSRILPAANYLEYMGRIRELKNDFDFEVKKFCAAYARHVDEAKTSLADLYCADDYPAAGDISETFAFDVAVTPMPSGNDFRVTLGTEEEERIRAEIEERNRDALAGAVRDLMGRVREVVSRMAEGLKRYGSGGEDGGRKGFFKDSAVSAVRDIVTIIGRLNVTEDPEIETVRRMIEDELCGYNADDLRKDAALRTEAAGKADKILAMLGV